MDKTRGKRPARVYWSGVGLLALMAFLLAGCAVGGASGGQVLSQQGSQRILSLAVDRFHPQLVYAGGDSGTIFDARPDRDVLFNNQSDIPSGVRISAILPDTRTPGVVYAGTSRGVYKTSDFGATWQAWGKGLPDDDTIAILAFGTEAGALLCGTVQHGVYVSADAGATWTASNAGLPAGAVNVNALLTDPASGAIYLALDQAGLFTSTDGGQQWRRLGQGVPSAANPLSLAELPRGGLNPTGPTLYAGTSQGIYASKDGGATWTAVAAHTVSSSVSALAADPARPGALYAGTTTALLRSTDGGATWTPIITGFSKPILSLAVVDSGGQPAVFATDDQVYRYPSLATTGGGPSGGIVFLFLLVLLLGTGFWAFRRAQRQMRETMSHLEQTNTERAGGSDGDREKRPEDTAPSHASQNGHKPR